MDIMEETIDRLFLDSVEELEFKVVLDKISKYCYSELGKELILKSLPVEDINWLKREHIVIEEMKNLIVEDESIPFEGVSDVRNLLYKSLIENAVLSSTEILKVKDFIRAVRLIKRYFYSRQEKYSNLFELCSVLYDNALLEKHIEEAIDDTGNVKDNATKELFRIRRELIDKGNYLRKRLEKIMRQISEHDMIMEEFTTIREERFVLPIKAEHKRHIPGIIHGVSQTGATVFLEPMEIFELNNELSLLKNEEKKEVYKILSNLTKEIGADARNFLNSLEIIGHLDAVFGKAKYAEEFGGIKPEIIEENEIVLKNIRHPILVHTKGLKNVVPLSMEFNAEVKGHLISGPNAGGKTVALKSVGLNVMMALSGIYPLGECRTNYRKIYTSIGDRQSIENDLSTFSSQILRMKEILANCDYQSLVLIDEICSGTDPQEGSALAAGIMDTFIEIGLFFVATTHQSLLKSYALNRKEMLNDSLEFDETNLKPTYKFLIGVPGNSYAFVLAENLGLPPTVLKRAKNYLGSQQFELEKSIRLLQEKLIDTEKEKVRVAEERLKQENARKELESKLSDFKQKRQKLMEEARQQVQTAFADANSLIERTIKEIREEKRNIKDIKKDFEKEKDKLLEQYEVSEKRNDVQKKGTTFKIGDKVAMDNTSSVGVIEGIEKNNIAIVNFNGVKFKLNFEQLSKVEEEKEKTEQRENYINFGASSRIDLRGYRAELAISELDDFINQAVLGNLDFITIIHGKGTGALRKAVQEFLSTHPSIASYRDGDLVEGGTGVTIAYLK